MSSVQPRLIYEPDNAGAIGSVLRQESLGTRKVREFHMKVGADCNLAVRPLTLSEREREMSLAAARYAALCEGRRIEHEGKKLIEVAKFIGKQALDEAIARNEETGWDGSPEPIAMRAGLILEELGEWMQAIAEGDVAQATKELADLDYVVRGTAVTFALPMDAMFDQVHAANMTKTSCAATKDGNRGKGEDYVPADTAALMNQFGGAYHGVATGKTPPSISSSVNGCCIDMDLSQLIEDIEQSGGAVHVVRSTAEAAAILNAMLSNIGKG